MAKENLKENELESDEFITLDDDEIDELFEDVPIAQENIQKPTSGTNTLFIWLIGILVLIILIGAGVFYYLYSQKKEKSVEQNSTTKIIKKIEIASKKSSVKDKNLSKEAQLIKKAEELYENGKKDEALVIQTKIAQFNKALTHYNLGVAKLKERRYEDAKNEFLLSSKNSELHFQSSLNLAIVAFYQKNSDEFNKNLQEARKYLITQKNSKLYNYYRALIDYYGGFFPESSVALHNPSSNYYQKDKTYLLAKIETLLQNYNKSVDILQSSNDENYLFTLGLLYAKKNELDLSSKYLNEAIKNNQNRVAAQIALALVEIKKGYPNLASKLLKDSYESNSTKATKLYPIKPHLKRSLFDPDIAQKEYQKEIFFNDDNRFSILFYYAPYMIMNPKFSTAHIQSGVKNIYINNLPSAKDNLMLSKGISDANIESIRGIQNALNKDLLGSVKIFKDALKQYQNSSRLHYNLALTYAKLNRFNKAKKEFKKSYILNQDNLLSMVFEKFCSKLLFEKIDRKEIVAITEKIQNSSADKKDIKLAKNLLAIMQKDIPSLNYDRNETIFDKAVLISQATLIGDNKRYKYATKELFKQIPSDIIANILDLDASHNKDEIKNYAFEIQKRLLSDNIDLKKLSNNAPIARELYIKLLSIAGVVPKLQSKIANLLKDNPNDTGLLQTLAYSTIYTKDFEKSYQLYNTLIDQFKQNDSHTLFLGATAAIGAKHFANAIALLELAKLTNSSNLESRFALALLYQEAKNLEAASIEYKNIKKDKFKSSYFDFDIISKK
ncbi:MAG: hypothetical protein DSZ06_00470 [Sulfurospirillum sp.]|nr:MAG: hypothetical protein DSZ06_00470 [Sulfurospirillum sp.]